MKPPLYRTTDRLISQTSSKSQFMQCLVQTKEATNEASYRILNNKHQRRINYAVVLLYLN